MWKCSASTTSYTPDKKGGLQTLLGASTRPRDGQYVTPRNPWLELTSQCFTHSDLVWVTQPPQTSHPGRYFRLETLSLHRAVRTRSRAVVSRSNAGRLRSIAVPSAPREVVVRSNAGRSRSLPVLSQPRAVVVRSNAGR